MVADLTTERTEVFTARTEFFTVHVEETIPRSLCKLLNSLKNLCDFCGFGFNHGESTEVFTVHTAGAMWVLPCSLCKLLNSLKNLCPFCGGGFNHGAHWGFYGTYRRCNMGASMQLLQDFKQSEKTFVPFVVHKQLPQLRKQKNAPVCGAFL